MIGCAGIRLPTISRHIEPQTLPRPKKKFAFTTFFRYILLLMDESRQIGQPAVFIETYGCQMNKSDTEIVESILARNGWRKAASPETADLLLINTCSVRQHAEDRALGRISSLAGWKEKKKGRRLGVIGCMAQRLGDELLTIKPHLDLVVGPDSYRDLPELLGTSAASCHSRLDHKELYEGITPRREGGLSAWLTIMRGCNNFCSYCIVPYTRGRERSRPANEILREIALLERQGYRELTLLGQNVNSYQDGVIDFPGLLGRISSSAAIPRLRFLTSHPKDLSPKLLEVIADGDNICEHIHLPLQAGSDRILRRMNRGYSSADYLNLVANIRRVIPDVALTTDIMVGFPGETEAEFEDTCRLVSEVRFQDAFTYHFSPRSGTPAASMPDQLPDEIRLERLRLLIDLQRNISLEIKKELIGKTVEVMVEIPSKQNPSEWMGRSRTDQAVIFPGRDLHPGERTIVRITSLAGSTLRGIPLASDSVYSAPKSRRKLCG